MTVYSVGEPKTDGCGSKISVIMQSYLGDYPGSRKNPEEKFKRAVTSFLNQTSKNNELVIVADGCKITERLWRENYSEESRIKFIYVEKEEIVVVEWMNIGWGFKKKDGKYFSLPKNSTIEIIGNIYEHKNLLDK